MGVCLVFLLSFQALVAWVPRPQPSPARIPTPGPWALAGQKEEDEGGWQRAEG